MSGPARNVHTGRGILSRSLEGDPRRVKPLLPLACLLGLAACATAPAPHAPEVPSIAGIALGQDDLHAVARRLGTSQHIERGNVGDVATETCYRVRDATLHELELRFAADREAGGVVTQARIMPARPALAAGCAPVDPSVYTLEALPHGLQLGLTPAQVEQALAGFTRVQTPEGELFTRTRACANGEGVDSVAVIHDGGVAAGYVIGRSPAC